MEMKNIYRDKTINLMSEADVGTTVRLAGWVENIRDHGGVSFVDLRDMYGVMQVVMRDTSLLEGITKEQAISVEGLVEHRDEETYNPKIPTGTIEMEAHSVDILGRVYSQVPFEIMTSKEVREDVRLKYRYLDLRKPKMQTNLTMRHKIVKTTRDYFDENGFMEVETPILIKPTPEGARDYIVPSRVHNGEFYALPQSPQMFKQILMVSGSDRYMQIAKCFRDEDLRADRQPEFTQIDLEMSFAGVDDVIEVQEGFIKRIMKDIKGIDIQTPLPRLSYDEAMERYGSDKPDTRFDIELIKLNDFFKDCSFEVFTNALKDGGDIRGICVPGGAELYSRKKIDKLTDEVKHYGAKGLVYVKSDDNGISSSISKFFGDDELNALVEKCGGSKGDIVFIVSGPSKVTYDSLGFLRRRVAGDLGLLDDNKFNFLWVVDFPMFEQDEDGRIKAMHHPFTQPKLDELDKLDNDILGLKANAYDIVLNGVELGGGSVRIHDQELQKKMFSVLGLTEEECEQKFGFLIEAFKYGAPPHAGLAYGLDRLVMLLLGEKSIREVIAFPKNAAAECPLCEAPAPAEQEQLDELGIELAK